MKWVIAFLIGLLIGLIAFLTAFTISSIFTLFKIGYKKYFKQISFLYKEYRNIENIYRINKKFNYVDKSGNSFNINEIYYYLTIISENNVKVTHFKTYDDSIFRFNISEYIKNQTRWQSNEYTIDYNSCILTSLLFRRFTKKINKLKPKTIDLEDREKLNSIINSDIRELKINKILSN